MTAFLGRLASPRAAAHCVGTLAGGERMRARGAVADVAPVQIAGTLAQTGRLHLGWPQDKSWPLTAAGEEGARGINQGGRLLAHRASDARVLVSSPLLGSFARVSAHDAAAPAMKVLNSLLLVLAAAGLAQAAEGARHEKRQCWIDRLGRQYCNDTPVSKPRGSRPATG